MKHSTLLIALALVTPLFTSCSKAASDKALREHIAKSGQPGLTRTNIDALRAAGPRACFEVWMELAREMADKPRREWTVDFGSSASTLAKIHKERSVEAVPVLLPALRDGHPQIRMAGLYALNRCCSKSRSGSPPADVLRAVIVTLGDSDPQVREEACECFVQIHPEWQAGLIDCLRHPSPLVRCTAIDALGGRGGDEDRVSRFPDAVLPMLDDSDAKVRMMAAVSLAQLGRGSQRVLALLRAAVQNEDPQLRVAACTALGKMGSVATNAIPDLVGRLSDNDKTTRQCAAMAMANIAPETAAKSEAACAILLEALEEGGMTGTFAAKSLSHLGPAAPATLVSALERATNSNHAFLKDQAKQALEKIRAKQR